MFVVVLTSYAVWRGGGSGRRHDWYTIYTLALRRYHIAL